MKNRADILVDIGTLDTNKNTSFPDNNNKEITALILRTWLDELLVNITEIVNSYFNKLDEQRLTSTTSYDNVGNNANWNGGTAPANQTLVNDELASRVKTIENSPPVQYTIELYANTDSTISNIFPLYGKVLLFGSVNKSSNVSSVSYQTSVDGGATWTSHADFATLDSYLTSNTTSTSFVLLRAIFTFLGGYIGEQVITLNYTQA